MVWDKVRDYKNAKKTVKQQQQSQYSAIMIEQA